MTYNFDPDRWHEDETEGKVGGQENNQKETSQKGEINHVGNGNGPKNNRLLK